MKFKIWDKVTPLITPTGKVFDASEVFEQYPASALPDMKYVVCDSPISMGIFQEFTSMRDMYTQMGVEIVDGMIDQQVLDAITYFIENPPEPEPTAEERMASAMEFQNLLNM